MSVNIPLLLISVKGSDDAQLFFTINIMVSHFRRQTFDFQKQTGLKILVFSREKSIGSYG